MKLLDECDKYISRTSQIFTLVGGGALGVMTLLIFFDVIGRYIFNSPLPSVYEISGELILPVVAFFGLSAADHIRVKLLVERLKGRARLIVELICFVIITAFIMIMIWQTGLAAATSVRLRETAEAIIEFPIYLARIAVVIGLVVFWLVLMLDIIRLINKRKA